MSNKNDIEWGEYPALPLDAGTQVLAEIASRDNGWTEMSDVMKIHTGQKFALSGSIAYEILETEIRDDGNHVAFKPVLMSGQVCIGGVMCEGGRTGILSWMYFRKEGSQAGKWCLSWYHTGWIHASELQQTAAEVACNIADEVARGETPLTGFDSNPAYQ